MTVFMDSRKRKWLLNNKGSLNATNTKFLVLGFCSIVLFTLVYRGFLSGGPFRPAPIVRKLAGFSSSVSYSIQDLSNQPKTDSKTVVELNVLDRVVFTDHVLVILLTNQKFPRVQHRIDCVYHSQQDFTVTYPMLSADEYGDDRWIIRCPTPPVNYTSAVGLKGHRDDLAGFAWVAGMTRTEKNNQTGKFWDMLAYDAVLDNNTVAVFVKGLHLRSDRDSDPSYFTCRFEHMNVSDTSKAITAAQEVIRCPIPILSDCYF